MDTNRREMLRISGTALLGTVAVGSASASGRSQSTYQLDDQSFVAYQDSGAKGVKEVMDDSGLSYKINPGAEKTDKDESGPDYEVSPNDAKSRYSKDDSDLTLVTFEDPKKPDRIRVQAFANIQGLRDTLGNSAWKEDAFGIHYAKKDWAQVGEVSRRFTPSEYGGTELVESINGGGVAVTVDLDKLPEDGFSVLLAHSFQNRSGIAGKMYASYNHGWSATPGAGINVSSIEAGLGVFNVSFSGGLPWINGQGWTKVKDEGTDGLI